MPRKRKKKRAETAKQTSIAIDFQLPENSSAAKVSLRPDGTIVVADADGREIDPVSMERAVSYERPLKQKIQTRWRLEGGRTSISGIPELSRYDSLFVIDTSTRTIDTERVSVACFFSFRLVPNGGKYAVQPEANLNFYDFRGHVCNPEMLAILKVANDVASVPGLPLSHRFAIVTDSELGSHDAINSRTMPIYGNYHLPRQFTLIYASADTGHEFLKRLVHFCDRQADLYFKELAKGAIENKAFQALREDPTVRYRFYRRKGLEILNPTVGGPSLDPGSTVTLFGRRT